MKLTLGFSPCPNDTFIFDALVNKKIDTGDVEFDIMLEDVETLNQWAIEGKLDVTKLSFPAFFKTIDEYVLLNAGSALGKGVGPLLISTKQMPLSEIANLNIAIPGINTTANLLLSFAFPEAKKREPMLFSEIEDAIINGKTAFGVIIHENRFTYQLKGLTKIADLGAFWEQTMHVPIPLGGIAVKRSINNSISIQVNTLIRQSIEYAFQNYPTIPGYVKQHSQVMDEDVMRQHIELYVNKYSNDLGNEGKNAIHVLYNLFASMQPQKNTSTSLGDMFLL
jgi:1,4-dihydroxy-6-naphthoate synthase